MRCLRHRGWFLDWLGVLVVVSVLFGATGAGASKCPPKTQIDEFGLHLIDGGSSVDAPVLASLVEIQVTGIVARARVTQIFTNPGDREVEAVYVFPIPDRAVVDSLRLRVGQRETIGEVHEKAQAEKIYRAAEADGGVASLLSMQRPDIFTTRVTQIGAGETVEVEIGLQFLVAYQDGSFQLRFPLVVAPRFRMSPSDDAIRQLGFQLPEPLQPSVASEGVNPAAFQVTLDAGFPLAELGSLSHAIERSRLADGRLIIQLADETTSAGRDFHLIWRPEPDKMPRTVVSLDDVAGERYALVMILPPNAPEQGELRLPRETVFVVDTSGSMRGTKLEQARDALLLALEGFEPGDKLNLIRFSDQPTALFKQAEFVSEATLENARAFIEQLAVDGGTEMVPALDLALEDDLPADEVRQVVFMTDGQVTREQEIYELLLRKLGRSRLFTVGIGAAPSANFMRQVAVLGRGTSTLIPGGSDVAPPMKTLLRAIDSPLLRDVQLVWNDPSVDPDRDALPAPIPDLYAGEPLMVAAKIGESTEVHASGWLRDRYLEMTVKLPELVGASLDRSGAVARTGIDREWARRRVESLMWNLGADVDPGEVRQQVVDLGLRYQLVTPFTSLVSVSKVRSAEPSTVPQRVLMPVNPVGSGVAETLVVTSQMPILDSSRTIVSCGIAMVDERPELLAADPWVALARQPGIRVDRMGFDRSDSGAPAPARRLAGRGGSSDGELRVDGVVIDRLVAAGTAPTHTAFREFQETSLQHDPEAALSGVQVDLRMRRGGNEWRSGLTSHAVAGSSTGSGTQDQILRDDRTVGEFGGPLVDDHLWGWIGSEWREGERRALDGDDSSHRTWTGLGKLDGGTASGQGSWTAAWNEGERRDRGLGAGPRRAESALLDLDSSSTTWSLGGAYVATSSFFASGLFATSESAGAVAARGGEAARWDALGVVHGGVGRSVEDRRLRQIQLGGSYFFDQDAFQRFSLGHELTFGARSLAGESRISQWGPDAGGMLPIDGAVLGLPPGDTGVAFFDPAGSAGLDSRHDSLWVQDEVEFGPWLARVGLRWDEQRFELAETGNRVAWSDLSPRLFLARTFGSARATVVRLAWARFGERLDADLLTRTVPGLAGRALFRGSSPLDGGGVAVAHQTDPDLGASPTDEFLVSIERSLGYDAVVSLGLVRRTQRDVMESRDLVYEARVLRPTVAGDYVLDHVASGFLPNGELYSVPVYSLRYGLQPTGAQLLTNGTRDVDYEGVILAIHKRFDQTWSLSGQLHYGEARWQVGESYAELRDPTDLLGAGDRDGDLVLTNPEDLDFGFGPWMGSRWSAEVAATVHLFSGRPWEFTLAGELHAREGDPLPYYAWDTAGADGQARRLQTTPAVDTFRMDALVTLDIQIAKELPEVGPFRTLLTAQVLNLTGENAVLHRELSLSGPRTDLANETVASRTVRFGVRFSWD